MEKPLDISPKPADWLKILPKNTGNAALDKVVERHNRKPKPQPGVTPGHAPSRNRRNETVNSEGKTEPHKPGE